MKKIPLENSGFFTKYAVVDDEDYERVNKFKWYYFKWKHMPDSVEIGGKSWRVYNNVRVKKYAVRLATENELYAGAAKLIFLSQFIDQTPRNYICYTEKEPLGAGGIPLNYQKEFLKTCFIHKNWNDAKREALEEMGLKWKGISETNKMRVYLMITYLFAGAQVNELYKGIEKDFIREELSEKTQSRFFELWKECDNRKNDEVSNRRKGQKFWLSLGGIEFEDELGKVFQSNGYKVKMTSTVGDGGIDLYLTDKGGKEIIVQCKAHKKPVGVGAIRDLLGTLYNTDADQAILASVSGFTEGVYDFAAGQPIKLLALEEILEMVKNT
jgi:HJR/Mrr/RecB family endonuclease